MKKFGKIIGVIGGLLTLFSSFLPWLIVRGGETLYGFYFGLLFIITIFLGLLGIVTIIIDKKIARTISTIIGLFLVVWSLYLISEIESFSSKYIGMRYDAEWLGEAAASFTNIGYGLYLVMVGGLLILIGSLFKEKVKRK